MTGRREDLYGVSAGQHLAAPVRVAEVLGLQHPRLQPVAGSSFDHGAEEVRERLGGCLAANLSRDRNQRMADGTKRIVTGLLQRQVVQMFAGRGNPGQFLACRLGQSCIRAECGGQAVQLPWLPWSPGTGK